VVRPYKLLQKLGENCHVEARKVHTEVLEIKKRSLDPEHRACS
jgi:hypothetical protein